MRAISGPAGSISVSLRCGFLYAGSFPTSIVPFRMLCSRTSSRLDRTEPSTGEMTGSNVPLMNWMPDGSPFFSAWTLA